MHPAALLLLLLLLPAFAAARSHQLFHIAVVIAAYIHYRAVLLLLEWRDASGGCALPVTGSVQQLLQELQQQGASLLHVDAAWIREQMRQYAQQHFGFSLAL